MQVVRLFCVLGLSVPAGWSLVAADDAPPGAAPEVPKPLAHWAFEDEEGDDAREEAGGHHGRIVGATPVPGVAGHGLLFERAKGQYVSIDYAKDFDIPTFTVAAWVKLTLPPTFSGILGTRFGLDHTFDLKVNAAKVHGDIGDGQQWIETAVNFYEDDTGTNGQGGKLALDRWYHVVYVVDAAAHECRLYLDADLKKTVAFQGTPRLMQPGQTMRIGASSPTEFMDGVIDEVRIWGVALTAEQVNALLTARPEALK
jgi:hypothetical protein